MIILDFKSIEVIEIKIITHYFIRTKTIFRINKGWSNR